MSTTYPTGDDAQESGTKQVSGDVEVIGRRKQYSKNGCRECKRRKIKCTEEKPYCLRCTRLNKTCSYPAAGEKVLRVSRRYLRENPELGVKEDDSKLPLNIQSYPQGRPLKENGKELPNSEMSVSVSVSKENTPVSVFGANTSDHSASVSSANSTLNAPPQFTQHGTYVNPPALASFEALQNLQNQPQHQPQQIIQNPLAQPNLYHFVPPPPPPSSVPIMPPIYPTIKAHPQPQPNGQYVSPAPHAIIPGIPGAPPYVAPRIAPPNGFGVYDNLRILTPRYASFSGASYAQPRIDTAQSATSYLSPMTQTSQTSEPTSVPLVGPDSDNIDMLAESFYSQNDLTILAADLNNLVSDIMYEFEDKFKEGDESLFNSAQWDFERNGDNSRTIPRNYSPENIKLSIPQERVYLEAFSAEFSGVVLPFSGYDKSTKTEFNPARDILLHSANNEPCLLSALLAMGAKCVHAKTKHRSHEAAYCSYLSKCLKFLAKSVVVSPTKTKDDSRNRQNSLTADIEAVLLTVLLMTTFNAANIKQDWRPHLRGARDLLLRHSTSDTPNTKVFVFCKFWFIILEILAGISSKKGGTLKSDKDIDSLINVGTPYEQQVLRELGFLLDNGFNILGGYSHKSLDYIRDYIKIMNHIRDRKTDDFNICHSLALLSLLTTLYKSAQEEFVDVNCVFPYDEVKSSSLLTDTVDVNGHKLSLSWQDASHQGYTCAMIITLLSTELQVPDLSNHIQFWASRIARIVSIFDTSSDEIPIGLNKYALLMVQWPIRTAGLHILETRAYPHIELFFKKSSLVTGSSVYALKRVKGVWKKRADGVPVITETDEELDTVSY